MNWLYYLLEANVYLSVFYLLYYVFLKNETLYIMNRVYLLCTCLLSFLIPMVQIGILKPVEAAAQTDLLSPATPRFTAVIATAQPAASAIDIHMLLLCGYLLGAGLLAVALIIKLIKLFSLARKQKDEITASYKLIYLDNSDTAFSFFSYLFIGAGASGKQTIIRHELVHIEQKHSADIFLLELIKIVSWFNPFIYLVQNSLKEIHEFIADEKTAAYENDPLTYASFLVNNAYGVGGSSITHSFFNYNLLKKRIIMLHQKRSGNLARLKYLLALPLCALLLFASTVAFSKSYAIIDLSPLKKTVANIKRVAPKVEPGDSSPITRYYTTKKGYKYREDGYLLKNKSDFRVLIVQKDGSEKDYYRSSTTPAQKKMLHEKYGYEFPTMNIFSRLPPPPPMPPAQKEITKRPPPPPPSDPGFKELSDQLGKTVHYPAAEFKNKETGNVVVQFSLDADHKITDVKLVKGSDDVFNAEVIRSIKAFKGTIVPSVTHPFYLTGVSFNISSKNGNIQSKGFDKDLLQSENYALITEIYAFD